MFQNEALQLLRARTNVAISLPPDSGKSLIICTAICDSIDTSIPSIQAVCFAYTLDSILCLKKRIESIGKYVDGLKIGIVYHGVRVPDDVHILIGTPLEMVKHIAGNDLRCKIKIACFDDADVTSQFKEVRELTQTLVNKDAVVLMCSSNSLKNQCVASGIPARLFDSTLKLSPNIRHIFAVCDESDWWKEVEMYMRHIDLGLQVIVFTDVSKVKKNFIFKNFNFKTI